MHGRYIVPVESATPATSNDDVLVEVSQEGSRPLDVRLVGCEGEHPYITHIKHGDIAELKHKFKGTNQEWEAILSHFLLHVQDATLAHDIRLVYTLGRDSLQLSFQQNVKGIKVTLGEILLPKDEEEEVNMFEWAQVSAQHHQQALQELAKLRSGASNEQDMIRKLQAQLDDFIKTKNDTEKEMLQQFMQLLNEKKRKIRDQSRLLAGAKVDKGKATTIQSEREATKPRKTVPSRASKRKATSKLPEPDAKPEPEPEPAVSSHDEMELDEVKAEEEEEDSGPGAATPDRLSDEETEDEQGEAQEEGATIPARRELPFGRTRGSKPAVEEPATESSPPTVAATAEGDEMEDEQEL